MTQYEYLVLDFVTQKEFDKLKESENFSENDYPHLKPYSRIQVELNKYSVDCWKVVSTLTSGTLTKVILEREARQTVLDESTGQEV